LIFLDCHLEKSLLPMVIVSVCGNVLLVAVVQGVVARCVKTRAWWLLFDAMDNGWVWIHLVSEVLRCFIKYQRICLNLRLESHFCALWLDLWIRLSAQVSDLDLNNMWCKAPFVIHCYWNCGCNRWNAM